MMLSAASRILSIQKTNWHADELLSWWVCLRSKSESSWYALIVCARSSSWYRHDPYPQRLPKFQTELQEIFKNVIITETYEYVRNSDKVKIFGWAISEASGSEKVKRVVCLFVCLSVCLSVCEHDNSRTRWDTASRFKTWQFTINSSAAIEIQPSSSIFKGSSHEALSGDFSQNFRI